MKDTYHLISLGCAKNLVDSEVMLGALTRAGFQSCQDPKDAGFLIVNTCGFIQPAVEEAIDEILDLVPFKVRDPEVKIVVVGCLVQRYKEKLVDELPEVDIFLGTEGPDRIADILLGAAAGENLEKLFLPERFLMSSHTPRTVSNFGFRTWLKITEGCSNNCSYCMIPYIRGGLRSRPVDDLVREAQIHDRSGVKELSIIAQDSTAFGRDLSSGCETLVGLLTSLLAGTTIPWLRVLYLYPSGIGDELLELIAENPRLLPYLDIPMQHVSDPILKAMNRRYGSDFLYRLVERIRNTIPNVSLRTTFLVGFPGESEKDFLQIESFMRSCKIDHVGVFPYSNEEGCRAEHFDGQLPDDEKQRRCDHLLEVQMGITEDNLRKYVGRIEPVLVEGFSAETDLLLQGRTRFQAPEVDGCVYINDGSANEGDIVEVEIAESTVYDLVGGIVN
jgi:ribosomal protein S12 methylthiotransferase